MRESEKMRLELLGELEEDEQEQAEQKSEPLPVEKHDQAAMWLSGLMIIGLPIIILIAIIIIVTLVIFT